MLVFRKLWDKYQEMEALLNKQTEGEADKDEEKAESEEEDQCVHMYYTTYGIL